MAGLDVVGRALTGEVVHRPGITAELLGVTQGAVLEAHHLVWILSHAHGGLKDVPEGVEVRPYLNKAESEEAVSVGTAIAEELSNVDRIQATVVGAAKGDPAQRVVGRVAGVVLAAGGSRRLGITKQLVKWRGKALVWHAARAAIEAGLSPVAVVTGAEEESVRKALGGQSVRWVQNQNWRGGQSTSVRVGLQAVQAGVEGVVFLLADMPFVTHDLVRALVLKHRETLCNVAPLIQDRRGNPVLFDRRTFEALGNVKGDRGGRQILGRYPLAEIPWDPQTQFDLDTDEDLRWLQAQDRSQR
jgi:molybdenum cofactor cytidylyltransferase